MGTPNVGEAHSNYVDNSSPDDDNNLETLMGWKSLHISGNKMKALSQTTCLDIETLDYVEYLLNHFLHSNRSIVLTITIFYLLVLLQVMN